MSSNTLLGIQTILIFLQMINGSLATLEHVSPVLTVILSAVVGAGQFFIQHVGNQAQPK
jgi:hypothetical protein